MARRARLRQAVRAQRRSLRAGLRARAPGAGGGRRAARPRPGRSARSSSPAAASPRLPEGSFLRINHDDYVHVTYTAGRTAPGPARGHGRVPLRRLGGDGVLLDRGAPGAARSRRGRRRGRRREPRRPRPELRRRRSPSSTTCPRATARSGRRRSRARCGSRSIRPTDARPARGQADAPREPAPRVRHGRGGVPGPPLVGVLPGVFDYLSAYVKARGSGGQPCGCSRSTTTRTTTAPGPSTRWSRRCGRRPTDIAEAEVAYAKYGAYNLRMLAEVTALARERGYAVDLVRAAAQHAAADASGKPTWGGVVPDARRATAALAAELGRPVPRLQAADRRRRPGLRRHLPPRAQAAGTSGSP